jgi:YHS domain-containing protein
MIALAVRTRPTFEPKKNLLPVLNKEAEDPVCGMTVDISRTKYISEHNGDNVVYFCCARCKQSFDWQPENGIAVSRPGSNPE